MSLKMWFPLNGDLHNQGCSNVQLNNINGTIENNGKIGSCYYLADTTRMYTDLFTPTSNNFSMCCWYKSAEDNTNSGYIIGLSQSSDPSFMLYRLNTTGFRLYTTSSTGYTHDIDITQWHHYTITYNGSEYKLYIDGEYKASRVQTIDYSANQYRLFLNCRSNNSSTNGNGSIYAGNSYYNDIRYYDHCLSPLEIKEISQGLILHYKLNQSNENLLLDSPKSYSATAYNSYAWYLKENLIANQTYTLQLWNVLIEHSAKTADQMNLAIYWGGGSVRLIKIEGATYFQTLKDHYAYSPYICVQLTPTEANAAHAHAVNKWLNVFNSISTADGTRNMKIGAWKLEKGAVATQWISSSADATKVQDSSGYNHNGTIVNTSLSLTTDTVRYNNCIHFNATDQKIKITNILTSGFGDSYTFAWWAKVSSVTPMHWGFADGIRLNGLYKGYLWNTGDGSSNPLYIPGTTTQVTIPTVNEWHHWVMTGDGTKCRVYQDGELWGEAKTYKSISGSTIYINGWNSSTDYSSDNYSISDFRIYCTPLLDNDIKSLYNISMRMDNFNNVHSIELIEQNSNTAVNSNPQIYHEYLFEDQEIGTTETVELNLSQYPLPNDPSPPSSQPTYSGSWVAIYYSSEQSPVLVTQNRYTKIPISSPVKYLISIPEFNITPTQTCTSTRTTLWEWQDRSGMGVTTTTSTSNSLQFYVLGYEFDLNIYDASENLLKTIVIKQSSSYQLEAEEIWLITNINYELDLPYNYPDIADQAASIEFVAKYTATSEAYNNQVTITTQNLVEPQSIKITKEGQLYNRIIDSSSQSISKIQFVRDGQIIAKDFIEI